MKANALNKLQYECRNSNIDEIFRDIYIPFRTSFSSRDGSFGTEMD
jgi:hypothetical protein